MGLYINPPDQSKEAFLAQHGEPCSMEHARRFAPLRQFEGDKLPVCLIDNGGFTAAGIAFVLDEFEKFSRGSDRRRKQWFLVRKESLRPYLPPKA
jgi:hypothetical protein